MMKFMNDSKSTATKQQPSQASTGGLVWETPKSPLTKGIQAHLVSFGERVTYTFAYGHEVGSVHFDRNRGEIFFKGHNIRNMDVEPWQWQLFDQLRAVLKNDAESSRFADAYGRTLDKLIAEKRK
jgi:hypothetical protein